VLVEILDVVLTLLRVLLAIPVGICISGSNHVTTLLLNRLDRLALDDRLVDPFNTLGRPSENVV
jgi:hypothetical protein